MKKTKTYTRSSSFFIALTFGFILLLVFSVLSFFLYVVSTSDFIGEAKSSIQRDSQHFLRWHDGEGIEGVVEKIEERKARRSDQIYFLEDENGTRVAGMLEAWPENVVQSPLQDADGKFFDMVEYEIQDAEIDASWIRPPLKSGEVYQIFTQLVEFDDGHRLLIGRNLGVSERLRDLVGELSGFALVVLAIIVVIGFWISMYVVNRVNKIANNARYVTETGDLSTRIETSTRGWDDLGYLADTINTMMDNIELLVENVKRVSDNIAHDLRTPLTRLQNRIERLSESEPIGPEEKLKLKADSEVLLSMFGAILRISEIESGKHVFERKDFDIKLLMEDVVEFFEPVANEKSIEIRTDTEKCVFPIDRDLIFQAALNVLENAIKFTPEGGRIDVSVSCQRSESVEITVSDSGLGVSDKEKEKIFDRFYRSDESRTTPGNGLGLSMVKAIIEFHRGSIVLEDNDPGLRFIMRIPR